MTLNDFVLSFKLTAGVHTHNYSILSFPITPLYVQNEVAKDGDIPESVWVVFENAISEAEAGFPSWIRYTSMLLLYLFFSLFSKSKYIA